MLMTVIVAVVGILTIYNTIQLSNLTAAAVEGSGKAGEHGRWSGEWCTMITPQGNEVLVPCGPKVENFPDTAKPELVVNATPDTKEINTSGYHAIDEDLSVSGDETAIIISADNVVLDGQGHIISGGSGVGIYLEGRNNVTIKNFNLEKLYVGINVNASTNINIIDNIVSQPTSGQCGQGVYDHSRGFNIESSTDVLISGNLLNDLSGCDTGISTYESPNVIITGNNFTGGRRLRSQGLYIRDSDNIEISDNLLYDLVSNDFYRVSQGKILNNEFVLCSAFVLYWEDSEISGNTFSQSDTLLVFYGSRNNISDNLLLGSIIRTRGTDDIISNNVLSSPPYIGIDVRNSVRSTITDNQISGGNAEGIYLSSTALNSIVANNTVCGSKGYDFYCEDPTSISVDGGNTYSTQNNCQPNLAPSVGSC